MDVGAVVPDSFYAVLPGKTAECTNQAKMTVPGLVGPGDDRCCQGLRSYVGLPQIALKRHTQIFQGFASYKSCMREDESTLVFGWHRTPQITLKELS